LSIPGGRPNHSMKIAILSRAPRCYSTKRLVEAAKARGHRVQVLDTLKFSLDIEQDEPTLYYKDKELSVYDAVIPRISAGVTFYGLSVLRQFEQMGVYTINPARAIARSRDKLHSMQILSRREIGIPHTAFVNRRDDVLPAIERVGGAPVIIKLLEGTQGVGVILADTVKIAQAIVETLQSTKHNVLIQKFVKESKGRDIRAFVVGDRVVGAMRRQAVGDEFRSNVHRGGSATQIELSEEYARTAIRAAKIMGLDMAGVDMLEGRDGPQIMEVNSSPGLEGIEGATGIDIAGAIIEEIEQKVLFPEVDLHQRMSLAAGYSIADLVVNNLPDLENKALRDTDLSSRSIQVISITKPNKSIIPNPNGDEVIEPGDTLLCYGEQTELRALIPPRKKKRRKRRIMKGKD
jgi:ribosomal protein S6--L-glutamate ligase